MAEQTNLFTDSTVDLSVRSFAAVMCCGGAITFSSDKNHPQAGNVAQLYLTDGAPKSFMLSLKNLKNSETSVKIQGALESMGLSEIFADISKGESDAVIFNKMREALEKYLTRFDKTNLPDYMRKFFEPNMAAFEEACKQANLSRACEFVRNLKNEFMGFQPGQSVEQKIENKQLVGA